MYKVESGNRKCLFIIEMPTTADSGTLRSVYHGLFTLLLMGPPLCTQLTVPDWCVDQATVIRGAGLSWDNMAVYGLLSLVAAAALFIAFCNLSRTKYQEWGVRQATNQTGRIHKSETNRLRSAVSKRDGKLTNAESLISTLAVHYSHALISVLFLTAFAVLAAGLLSGLPTFVYGHPPSTDGTVATLACRQSFRRSSWRS